MTENTLLEIFLLVDVFLIGGVVAFAAQHASRFRAGKQEPVKSEPYTSTMVQLPADMQQRLIEASYANFKLALERSAVELHKELLATGLVLNKQLDALGREVVAQEMERYRQELDQLRKRAETIIGGAQSEVAEHQAQLKARLAEEMAAEKQRLINQLDTKLADAVAAFLIETLGHDIDLGAQMPYLVATLEEHKAEIIGEVAK